MRKRSPRKLQQTATTHRRPRFASSVARTQSASAASCWAISRCVTRVSHRTHVRAIWIAGLTSQCADIARPRRHSSTARCACSHRDSREARSRPRVPWTRRCTWKQSCSARIRTSPWSPLPRSLHRQCSGNFNIARTAEYRYPSQYITVCYLTDSYLLE